ncbi:MAG: 16S rRNA (cytosine(1402)-N(4))-methyltransferase RsmH [Candidatus Omnitrophica bacterium]|nr:16S rRNA (cytosine(1402)-N(4))-methyltransferase RsmH [Candidatus Omnitrophota bacterium]
MTEKPTEREESPHLPVMVPQVLEYLNPKPGGIWIDGTSGFGGHSSEIARRIGESGRLIGLDVDPEAIDYCRNRLKRFPCSTEFVQAGYEDLESVLDERKIERVDGILLDLGISSAQVDRAERGFSFRNEGPLDMRMDPDRSPSAAEWLAEAEPKEIRDVLQKYGEEKRAHAIAKAIARERDKRPIETTAHLAEIVLSCFPDRQRAGNVHPATRTFQALRILVNRELERLETFLSSFVKRLETKGRVVILSYHSLEDRMVKNAFRDATGKMDPVLSKLPIKGEIEGTLKVLTRKAVRPTETECLENPRARSAKLRAAERTSKP